MIFVEGIRNVNLSNGVVRLNCVATGPDGQQVETGSLAIPAAVYTQLLRQFTEAGQQMKDAQAQTHANPGSTQ